MKTKLAVALLLMMSTIHMQPMPSEAAGSNGYQENAIKPTVLNASGQSPFAGTDTPDVKWVFETEATGEKTEMSSPIIGVDGSIYIVSGGTDRQLYSVSSKGTKEWAKPILFNGAANYLFPHLNADGNLYIKTLNAYEYKLNGVKSTVSDIGTPFWGSLAMGNDGTAYSGGSGIVHAFNPDLKEIWNYKNYSDNKTPVLGNDGTLYVLAGGGQHEQLIALDSNGVLKWAYTLQDDIHNSIPVVSNDGTIYVTTNGALYAIKSTGQLKWKKELPDSVGNSIPSVDSDGTIYVAYDRHLLAVSADGSLKWKFDAKRAINTNQISRTIIDKNGAVYFTDGDEEEGSLYAVSENGSKKWELSLAGAAGNTPAINADGTVYITTSKGQLYAIGAPDEKDKALTEIKVSSNEMPLKKGEHGVLKAAAVFDNLSRENITDLSSWESSDPSVVSISAKGVLMAEKEGGAEVSVKYNGFEQKVKVTVKGVISDNRNPFEGKDQALLDEQASEALSYLNEVRTKLGIGGFTMDESLRKAAQSHSNYKLANGDGFSGAHYQESDGLKFTGNYPVDRANYFGYEGSVDEGIARLTTAKGAAEGLLNAPYHRLSIVDPNYQDIGIGYNHLGVSVMNYATKGGFDDGTAIAYPYDGQTDVPPIWFDNEIPSPLSIFGKDRTYSGFPISLSVHDQSSAKLTADEVHLWDSDNKEVAFYLVDDKNDPSYSQKNIFIIPKDPLAPGSTYRVSVKANRTDIHGKDAVLQKEWSFTTQASLKIQEMYFNAHQNGAANLQLPTAIKLETAPADLPDIHWTLKDIDGKMLYSVEGSSTNQSIHYDQSSNKNMMEFLDTLAPGSYLLEIGASLFSGDQTYKVTLDEKKQFTVGKLVENSIVSPLQLSYDRFKPVLPAVSLALNGNQLLSITNGEVQLVEGRDYSLVNETVELQDEYLRQKGNGSFDLVFKFNAGASQTVAVTVMDTTPIDMVAPGKPAVDKVTNESTEITGTTEAGALIKVYSAGKELGKVEADGAGKFAVAITKQKADAELSVTATDRAGNTSAATVVMVLDAIAPEAPVVDAVTDKDSRISGIAEASSTVLVKIGTKELAQGKAGLDGKFSFAIETQVSGSVLTVVSIDAAGNVSLEAKLTVADAVPESAERISGTDRYQTAIAISKSGWTSAHTVVLATASDFPDALAGGPLAYQEDAPILLTKTKSLTAETKQEIMRLGAEKIIILGSHGAVSAAAEAELTDMGIRVERIGGKNRYDTAALIAEKLEADKAVIANGQNFPDVLSVSSYASKNGIPILLTRTDRLPDETKSALFGMSSTYVIGSTSVVSTAVYDSLPKPVRYGGKDRYETGYEVATKLPLGTSKAFIATGSNFPDALAGSVLAAKTDAPILLVRPQQIPEATSKQLAHYDDFSIFGGSGAVSDDVISTLNQVLENK